MERRRHLCSIIYSDYLDFFPFRNHGKFRSDDWFVSYSERKSERKKSNRMPGEQLTAALFALLASISSIGARRTVVLTSRLGGLAT